MRRDDALLREQPTGLERPAGPGQSADPERPACAETKAETEASPGSAAAMGEAGLAGEESSSGRPGWLRTVSLIWCGYAASSLCSMAASYAAVWYVTESTGSALALGAVYLCAFLPVGLLSPLGGALADRVNRRTVVVACDLLLALASLVFCLLVLAGVLSLVLVLAFCLAWSCANAFRQPAFNACMPLLVPRRHLVRINTLDGLVSSVSMIASPALGILLYTASGLAATFALNAAGALLSGALMFLGSVPTVRDTSREGVALQLSSGMRAMMRVRGLVPLVVCIAAGMAAYGPVDSLLPLHVSSHFAGDGFAASLVAATFGAGMLAGSLAVMAFAVGRPLTRVMAAAAFVCGGSLTIAGLLPQSAWWPFVACLFVMAFACAAFGPPLMTIMQTHVAPACLGRAMGLYSTLAGLAVPVGTGIGSAVAEAVGTSAFFTGDGCAILLISFAVLLLPGIRSLDMTSASACGPRGAEDTG